MKSFSIFFRCVGILILVGMLAACSDDPETAVVRESPEENDVAAHADRAVLVYLLADNSLGADGYDRMNLREMIDAAADGCLQGNRLIIYHDDRKAGHPMLKEVTAKGLKILKEYDNSVLSTSSARMAEAIEDFKAAAPAERYGLIFWSHASGWPLANVSEGNGNGASPLWVGEDRGNFMDITDLHGVLSGRGFDYIYFDCCFMASVEALYEIRDVADYFVASAAELPAEGMPYYEALPYLMAKDADVAAAARATFSKYDSLSGASRTSTISVIDAAALEGLANATSQLFDFHPVLANGYTGQPFERRKNNGEPCYLFDLEDYIDNLQSDADGFPTANAQWKASLSQAVVYEASTPWIFNSVQILHHCGLTSYILRTPADATTKGYCNLAWYRDVASRLY